MYLLVLDVLFIFFFSTKDNFAVFRFERADILTYQIEDLPICRTSLVFCYIVKFAMQFGFNFYSQMLVALVSQFNHHDNLNLSIF